MTEDQLKEIPYTVVETTQNRKRNNTNSLKVHKSAYGKDRVDRIRGWVGGEPLSSEFLQILYSEVIKSGLESEFVIGKEEPCNMAILKTFMLW